MDQKCAIHLNLGTNTFLFPDIIFLFFASIFNPTAIIKNYHNTKKLSKNHWQDSAKETEKLKVCKSS